MSQNFPNIESTDTLRDSRPYILDRDSAVMSCFAGTAFPSDSLVVGMLCLRIDIGANGTLYQLVDLVGPTWRVIAELHKTPLRQEDADARYSQIGHGHTIADVTSLQASLDGKALSAHSHSVSDITDFTPANYVPLAGATMTGTLSVPQLRWRTSGSDYLRSFQNSNALRIYRSLNSSAAATTIQVYNGSGYDTVHTDTTYGKKTISSAAPSGGNNGDIWFQY